MNSRQQEKKVFLLITMMSFSLWVIAQSPEQDYKFCDSLNTAGQFEVALPFCENVIAATQGTIDQNDSLFIYASFWKAYDIAQSGDLSAGFTLFDNLADFTFQRHGWNDNYIIIRQHMLDIAEATGDKQAQIKCLNDIIAGIKNAYSDTSALLINYYYKNGEATLLVGDYAASLNHFAKARDLQLFHHPVRDAFYARILVEMSSPYLTIQKYDASIQCDLEAVAIMDSIKHLKKSRRHINPDYDITVVEDAYELLSWNYKAKGDIDLALEYVNKQIEISDQLEPITRAGTLIGASLFIINYDIAYGTTIARDEGLLKALDYAKDIYDTATIDPIFNTNLYMAYGNYYINEKNYDSVMYYYRVSADIVEQAYGKNNIIYLNALMSLGQYAEMGNDITAATAYYDSLLAISEQFLHSNFAFLSESEQESILNAFTGYRDMVCTFYRDHRTPEETAALFYNSALFMKGLLLQNITSLRNRARAANSESVLQLFNTWIAFKEQLAAMYLNHDPGTTLLEQKVDELEKELTESNVLEAGGFDDSRWENVRQQLKEDEAAVEIMHYSDGADDQYAALIVRHTSAVPVMITLPSGTELAELLHRNIGETDAAYVDRLYTRPDTSFTSDSAYYAGDRLYDMLWAPLETALTGVHTIYLSPSGVFMQIAFNGLSDTDNRSLLDQYHIIYMNSTRLLNKRAASKPFQSALLIGGVNYNIPGDNTPPHPWRLLPGTMSEVNDIGGLLKGSHIAQFTLSGDQASEVQVCAEAARGPELIHFATHGYFFSADEDYSAQSSLNKFSSAKNPLLRSGLILSTGNAGWADLADAGNNDGVLTAYEISNLDLTKTRLVVMSACETGLGDVRGAEGVYGLQRAFKMAGVEQEVISLWQVPDRYTSELMDIFYHLLLSGISAENALRQAQLILEKKSSAYNWAAFILIE